MPYLFTNALLTSFPKDVKDKYNNYKIIYGRDIESVDENRMVLKSGTNVKRGKPPDYDKFFDNITKTCIGRTGYGVDRDYAISAIKKAMTKAKFQDTSFKDAAGVMYKHDLLFIAKPSKIESEIRETNILLNDIQGFILTQTGECSLLPDVPALKIICSINSEISKFLMYIYIKALLKLNITKGILELAHSYENPGGFCLYNKFGFREDSSLDRYDCFPEGARGDTLAMQVDLTDTGLLRDLDSVLLMANKNIDLENLNSTGEPMCNKQIDIGKAASVEQQEYIALRTQNREYLRDLFIRNDEDEIREILEANDIDIDVLMGDGVNSDFNYALKELIEMGKIMAVNEKKELAKIDKVFNSKQKKSKGSVSKGKQKKSKGSVSNGKQKKSKGSVSKSKKKLTRKKGFKKHIKQTLKNQNNSVLFGTDSDLSSDVSAPSSFSTSSEDV